MTYGTLLHYHKQIEGWKQTNSIFVLSHKSFIREFYNNNGVRIKSLMERMNALMREHFVYDDNGLTTQLVDGKQELILQEGKTQVEYDTKLGEILTQPCNIIY